ncbi:MAG: putative Ig domain-containing protein [Nannocystaceae bacterium]
MRPSHRFLTLGLALLTTTACNRDELAPYGFPAPITVECESPPRAYVGVPYSWTPDHQGGKDPLTWSATGLPDGLMIDPMTGEISGTPTAEGDFEIEITVKDSSSPAQVSVVSCGAIQVLPGGIDCGDMTLPDGVVGEPYMGMPIVTGGTPPYTWVINGLPPGLMFDASTGAVTGSPTTMGTYPVTITATDSTGAEFTTECGDVVIFPRLDVDGDKLLQVYPDGCVGPGVTLQDLIDNGVVIGGDMGPITCELRGGLGNGNFPLGISINADTCEIQGNVDPSQRFGMYVWITTLIQGNVNAHVPYCAPQPQQAPNAYAVTKLTGGVDSTLKPGTTKMAGSSASYGDNSPDPVINVEQTCNAPACFYKFYFAYNTLSAMASVSANPNGKLGMGMAFDGFFHAMNFTDPGVSANISSRHWVVNFGFDYCISDVEADCDTKDKAVMNGDGSNLEFGVIVRP